MSATEPLQNDTANSKPERDSSKSTLLRNSEQNKSRIRLQARLSIGANNDPLEQEADRVADNVMAAPASSVTGAAVRSIQRVTGQTTRDAGIAPASVERVLSSPGKQLDPALQQDMGQRFGHDFSRVRVHTGVAAEQSARDVNALAYTAGQNIVFGAGRFSTASVEGKKLLAHELTHVVQQTDSTYIHDQGHEKLRPFSVAASRVQRQPDPGSASNTELRPSSFFLRSSGHLVIDAFPTGQSILTDDQRSSIHAHARTLLLLLDMDPGGQAYVTGHGDAPGSLERNHAIGLERANVVRDELVAAGVPVASIVVDSAGETEPVNPGTGADPANRRAVIGFSPMLRIPELGRARLLPGQLTPPSRLSLGAGSAEPGRSTLPDLRHLPSDILDPGLASGPRRPTPAPDIFRPVPPPPERSQSGLRQFFERDPLLRALPDFLRNAAIDGLLSAPDAIAGKIAGSLPAGETRDGVEAILRALAGYMTGRTWSPPPSRDPRFDMPPATPFPSSPGQVIIPGPTFRF